MPFEFSNEGKKIFNNGIFVVEYVEGELIKYDVERLKSHINKTNITIFRDDIKKEENIVLYNWDIPIKINQKIRIYSIYFINNKIYYSTEENCLYVENLSSGRIFENPKKIKTIIDRNDRRNSFIIPFVLSIVIILFEPSARVEKLVYCLFFLGIILLALYEIFILRPLVAKIKEAIKKNTKCHIK